MASSFHIFRRNQKLMLAILTLLAMFAFVFLDPLLKLVGRTQSAVNPVVAETKYGQLKGSDLGHLEATRGMVAGFLKMLAVTTVEKLMDQGMIDVRSAGLREYYTQQLQNQFLSRIMRSQRPTEPHAVVDTMLLARKAEAMNVVVSDEAINAMLKQLTMNTVNAADMAKIIGALKTARGGQLNDRQLFDALRTELAASTIAQSFAISINATPPAESWDYYKRLNQKAKIETVPVKVADLVDRVPNPTDEELKAFFDEHKDRMQIPGSPEPGIKLPRRQRFQYFKAEYDLFREPVTVTDEEVEKYYEDNKQLFRKIKLPEDKPTTEQEEKPTSEDPEPTTDTPEKQPPTTDESKPTPKPAESPASKSSKNDSLKPQPQPKANDSKKSGSGAAVDRFRRLDDVEFQLVADEKPAKSAPTDSKRKKFTTKGEAKPVETPAEKSTEDKPAAEEPAEEKPGDEKPTEEKPAGEPPYEPLEKVKEQIIRTLKGQKADKKIREGLDDLTSSLRAYSDARMIYELKEKADPTAKPPKEPDFIELAKQYNFTFEETKLVSYFELSSSQGLGSSRYGNLPFAVMAFRGTSLSLYSPVLSEDNDGNAYLSWKVEDLPEQDPAFEDVRDQVLKTWKLIKARDLARQQAETYAAEAKGAKQKLSEVFADDKRPKVITAGPFSWMTLGTTADNAQSGVPMLSEVVGIESPSMEFMQTTFGLDKGEIGVAMNGPKDTCYVVQVIDYEPPTEELEEDFAREDFRKYLNVAVGEKQQMLRAWMASVERDAGLKWLQEPTQEE